MIGNNTFRKRKEINERATFSCYLCEAEKRFVSATAEVIDGQYKLKDFPKPEDHICWASGQDISIRAARTMMYKMIEEDPTRPVLDIYEEVRKTFTEDDRDASFFGGVSQLPGHPEQTVQETQRVHTCQPEGND